MSDDEKLRIRCNHCNDTGCVICQPGLEHFRCKFCKDIGVVALDYGREVGPCPHCTGAAEKPTLPDNFANYPETVGARRAMNSRSGSDWTPRDVLINLLREIDGGSLEVDVIVVAFGSYQSEDRSVTRTSFAQSGSNMWEAVGLVEKAKKMLMEGG